ncbi:MAG: methyltransferase domain-containing protein [Acidobacteria bacterium]|nr:methyltransferase domain-containing protein [Acidobacteriota bacterium]
MKEFTGERVIPGEVDADLLNEHVARYVFAARLARDKRVLDAGCGVGYGAARLAAVARQTVGLEIAADAVEAARLRYDAPQLAFLRGDCCALPFDDGSFDLVVAFEVIEHLESWESLLAESRRILTPGGALVISTPNRLYYAESRESPNPFHVHEFDHEEFRAALAAHFPHVSIFFENHAPAVVFSCVEHDGVEAEVEERAAEPATAHFFTAICSAEPLDRLPAFVYLPQSGNVLWEREKHVSLLAAWLEEAKESLAKLHAEHQALEREAAEERERAQEAIRELEEENARKTEWARQVEAEVERLKGLLETLQAEYQERTAWALQLEAERQRLVAEVDQVRNELKISVDQLHWTEAELEKRTAWAQDLDRQVERLTADLHAIFGSLAYRVGRRIRLAPTVPSDPNFQS